MRVLKRDAGFICLFQMYCLLLELLCSQQQSQQSTPAVNRSQQQSAFIRLAHPPAFGACCLSLCKVVKCSSKRGARDRHGGDLERGVLTKQKGAKCIGVEWEEILKWKINIIAEDLLDGRNGWDRNGRRRNHLKLPTVISFLSDKKNRFAKNTNKEYWQIRQSQVGRGWGVVELHWGSSSTSTGTSRTWTSVREPGSCNVRNTVKIQKVKEKWNFHSTPPTRGVKSTSWNSVRSSVCMSSVFPIYSEF